MGKKVEVFNQPQDDETRIDARIVLRVFVQASLVVSLLSLSQISVNDSCYEPHTALTRVVTIIFAVADTHRVASKYQPSYSAPADSAVEHQAGHTADTAEQARPRRQAAAVVVAASIGRMLVDSERMQG